MIPLLSKSTVRHVPISKGVVFTLEKETRYMPLCNGWAQDALFPSHLSSRDVRGLATRIILIGYYT